VNHENPLLPKRLDSREKLKSLVETRIVSKFWPKLKADSKNESDQQQKMNRPVMGKFKKEPKESESRINGVW
jgi:hypothetical protein